MKSMEFRRIETRLIHFGIYRTFGIKGGLIELGYISITNKTGRGGLFEGCLLGLEFDLGKEHRRLYIWVLFIKLEINSPFVIKKKVN